MRRLLLAIPLALTACGEQEPSTDAAAPTVPVQETLLILQCDGVMTDTMLPRPSRQRRHYRIDLKAKAANTWNPQKKAWTVNKNETETVEVSGTDIRWSTTWVSEDREASASTFARFDRALGTVTDTMTMFNSGQRSESVFEANCIKVDEPSTERAF